MPTLALRISKTSLGDLRWQDLREALADSTGTDRGAELARELPFLDRDEAELSLARIQEARGLVARELPLPLGGIPDVRAALARAAKGAVLEPGELIACASLGSAGQAVRRFVRGLATDVPLLDDVVRGVTDLAPLASRIQATFEPSGAIRDDASVELSEQRRRARSLHRAIKQELDALIKDDGFALRLQESYYSVRNDRYVVPLKAHFRAQVPGIVHNASQSGQTIFVEVQQLVPLGNELAIAESIVAEEERRVLTELSGLVADRAADLEKNAAVLAHLDVIQASAKLADILDCVTPQLGAPQAAIMLRAARHPLLVLQGRAVVPNTITIEEAQRALVISGPNAGGKTVAMATVGLCVLMARAGLPIPAAEGSIVPFVTGLDCAIGDAQDLSRDLSTFTAHLQRLASILEAATAGWLCLIDEIASGTDPTEGAAIATACLETLVDADARVVVTTHLEEVKAYAVNDPRFANARVGLDADTLQPTFELELGVPGVSSAIDVAAHAGLPARVIARARENLQESGALSLALETLERERHRVASLQRELEEGRRRLAEQRAELEGEAARLARARASVEVTVRDELRAELQTVRQRASEAVASLQAGASMQRAQRVQRDMDAAMAEVDRGRAVAEVKQKGEARGVDADAPLSVGDRVRVVSLGRDGEVLAIDGDTLTVAVGSLRTRARRRDVVPMKPGQSAPSMPPGKRKRDPRDAAAAELGERAARLDVRGLRVDDALRELEEFLDQSYFKGPSRLLIVHGHGSGALRDAMREVLSTSPYVASFRPGDRHEGGDGATYVELNP